MSYNLPNPSLVGLLLVVSTHNGPQIVYSYPPELNKRELLRLNPDEDVQNDDDFDDEDYEEDEPQNAESTEKLALSTNAPLSSQLGSRDLRRLDIPPLYSHKRSASEDKRLGKENAKPAAGQVLGFEPEVLAEMLSPPREMCNCRFDIMLESMIFCGLPIHVQPGGSWRLQKRHAHPTHSETANWSSGPGAAGGASGADGLGPEEERGETADSSSRCPMSMFHLVFVMNPPKIERTYRTDEMFYYVILKLLFILRYEQHKRNYIWEQVKLISRLKEEHAAIAADARTEALSEFLMAGLLLCKTINQCFVALVASRVAHLNINGKLHSFQIPLKMEFHSLPEVSTPYVPGSYLSSTTSFLGDTGLISVGETTRYSGNSLLDQVLGGDNLAEEQDDDLDEDEYLTTSDELLHLGLLLWDDPDTIIKEIKAKLNSAIAVFIRMIRPTESLLKVYSRLEQQYDGKLDLNLSSVRDFALHLVHWRKARMIPPLNTRGIYIVSPMAPIGSRFHRDIAKFNAHFPTIPSLPLFLKSLSTRSKKPRQFASIVPSKDHRDIYLLALAWLVRYGYATQLHTYIWLKVSRKIKMKVEEELESELGNVLKKGMLYLEPKREAPPTDNKLSTAVDNSSKQAAKNGTAPQSLEDEIGKLQRRLEMSQTAPDILLEDDSDTILVDPGRASSLERRWINEIIYKECELSPEMTAIFYKLLKYMNGRNLLEILLLKEDITRAELRKLLMSIESHIISVRHW